MTNRRIERLKKKNVSFLYLQKAPSPFHTKLGRELGVEGTFLSSGLWQKPQRSVVGGVVESATQGSQKSHPHSPTLKS